MEKSFPFNAVMADGVPDRVYTAEDFAAERAAYVSNGVTAAQALLVSPSEAGGMAVDLAPGTAVIDGYTYFNTSPRTLEIQPADGVSPRADLCVLRLDLAARHITASVKTGEPAEVPVPPVCTFGETVREIPLCEIFVPAGETVLGTEHLTDRRPRADYILNRMEVEEAVRRYENALSDYFDGEDAHRLTAAAKAFRTDAGEYAVLCGDGAYRSLLDAYPGMKELCRFTEAGTFRPADHPTADGLYTVLLQGAGGSGSAGTAGIGGSAGAMAVIPHLPLTGEIPVTPGKGGTGKTLAGGASDGFAGGATVFGNFRVPGGEGGGYSSAFVPTPATAGIFTASVGTAAAGAPSLLGAGGVSSAVGDGVPGGIGAGGGRTSASGCTSGAGGDGVVIVYGVPAEITEATL